MNKKKLRKIRSFFLLVMQVLYGYSILTIEACCCPNRGKPCLKSYTPFTYQGTTFSPPA
jgi:hypothetical protein